MAPFYPEFCVRARFKPSRNNLSFQLEADEHNRSDRARSIRPLVGLRLQSRFRFSGLCVSGLSAMSGATIANMCTRSQTHSQMCEKDSSETIRQQ
jgi:hypothetical protein